MAFGRLIFWFLSTTAEPVVPLVFPIAARIGVGDEHRDDVFRIFIAQLGGHAQLHRIAVFRRQRLAVVGESQQRLRVQRGRHVYAGVIVVRAFEADIFRREVGPDALEESRERDPAPFADRAPSLDADMAGDLVGLRQPVQLFQRPVVLVRDQAADFQPVVVPIDLGNLVALIVGVERERLGDHGFGISGRQFVRVEQPCLDIVVEARDFHQHALGGFFIGHRASAQQRQAAQRERRFMNRRRAGEGSTLSASWMMMDLSSVFFMSISQRPRIIMIRVFGTSATITTWTAAKASSATIPKKWTMRARS